MDQTRLCILALHLIPGIGDYLLRQLISYCGSAEKVFTTPRGKLLKIPGVGEVTVQAISAHETFGTAERELRLAEKHGVDVITFLDEKFPTRLRSLAGAPPVLYCKGTIDFENKKAVAIVGTRKATAYGKQFVDALVEQLVPHDPLIVSGLAYGIDIQAHRQAVRCSLQTIGIMGSGIDVIYPASHAETAHAMMNRGGLVTENQFGARPDAFNFPARNRIIAGLCDALIVVEAAERGGALITADIANSFNKDVFALPGNINETHSQGCNQLIRDHKAHLITSLKDLEYIMNWQPSALPMKKQHEVNLEDFDSQEQSVLQSLQEKSPCPIDELSWRCNQPVHQLAGVLLGLEFKGVIKSLPGKQFALVT